jgi:glycosyltransferase involved in cell wall biosynthesis
LYYSFPQVIHVVADGFSQFFAFIAMTLRIPIVASFHTDLIDLLETHGALGFQKQLVTTKEAIDSIVMDSCATTSKSFMKKLKKQHVHCEHVIITAVDNKLFHPDKRSEKLRKEMMFGDENGFLCVYVGRISGEKRLDVVIEAIKNLEINDGKKAYLAIIGDGPSAAKYAEYHGPENRVYCRPKFLNHPELAEVSTISFGFCRLIILIFSVNRSIHPVMCMFLLQNLKLLEIQY